MARPYKIELLDKNNTSQTFINKNDFKISSFKKTINKHKFYLIMIEAEKALAYRYITKFAYKSIYNYACELIEEV